MIVNIVIALLIYEFIMFILRGLRIRIKKSLQKLRAKIKNRFLNKILVMLINAIQ